MDPSALKPINCSGSDRERCLTMEPALSACAVGCVLKQTFKTTLDCLAKFTKLRDDSLANLACESVRDPKKCTNICETEL